MLNDVTDPVRSEIGNLVKYQIKDDKIICKFLFPAVFKVKTWMELWVGNISVCNEMSDNPISR